jgi:AhpD family alkylhydroperoxidase
MESQVEVNNRRLEMLEKFKGMIPDFATAQWAVIQMAYKEGALSTKTKRLMALAVALRARCINCILGQTQLALDAGATREEILETIQVVVAMSGTTGVAESLRVIQFLDELGR